MLTPVPPTPTTVKDTACNKAKSWDGEAGYDCHGYWDLKLDAHVARNSKSFMPLFCSPQFCIMPSDKRSPSFIFYVSKTRISDLVSALSSPTVSIETLCSQ